uniref:acetyl-CoA carboxylase subunit beta n=1 Tax=Kostermansia malayana TaxID=117666 RepID=UPI0030026E7E|nr:acetyl-CoA carboxylase subunit beta [Kostermansia malayana]
MEKLWFNLILSKGELEYRCGLSKSMDSLGPIENTSVNEDPARNDMDKNIHGCSDSSSYYSKVDHLVGVKDIRNCSSDDTPLIRIGVLIRDSNQDSYFLYFDSENQIFEIDNDHSFLSELESFFYSYRNSSYINNGSKNDDPHSDFNLSDTNYSWNNHVNSCINSYLRSQTRIDSSILSGSDNYNDSYIYNYICGEGGNSSEGNDLTLKESCANGNDLTLKESCANDDDLTLKESCANDDDLTLKESCANDDDLTLKESCANGNDLTLKESCANGNDLERPKDFKHLWVLCENEDCYGLNYKKFLKPKMNICEYCGYHLKMSSSDRIELSIDPGTWDPMDEDMISLDPIEFQSDEDGIDSDPFQSDEEEPYIDGIPVEDLDGSDPFQFDEDKDGIDSDPFQSDEDGIDSDPFQYDEDGIDSDPFEYDEEPYKDRLDSYQRETGLTEAIQTGTGQLNGIPIAIGVMDFQFMGGSMGSVVGEKITRLIEYATNNFLPLILVCASGGARMQEGSLSLMQMAKISSALYDYQSNKKLFYVSILTSPTTGGVTASFGMLGDIIIAEPNAYIAFAGKRVIEQTLNITVPEGSQEAEYLFHKGLFDPIVPRNPLKGVLSELFQLHGFFPLNQNSIK